jgi:predicted metal-binding protein
MDKLIERALVYGFSHASVLDATTLTVKSEVRDMCSVDKCHNYAKSWMCPPACGGLEENALRLKKYRAGIIVQTTGDLDDDFDYEAMMETADRQFQLFSTFRTELYPEYPNMLALGSGTCKLCEVCSYPDLPCRNPEKAISSMEAYGLFVSEVCQLNNIGYYYGPRTITYTGCFLLF